MKHIVKQDEPPEFTGWKTIASEEWQPAYNNLRGDIKNILHAKLIEEQGFICCYCEQRIDESNSHIEHLKPKSRFASEELSYENLSASCMRETKYGDPVHCGHLKGDWYDESLFVTPLNTDCEKRFRYTADGHIYPYDENDLGAKETIRRLGLDIPKLNDMRRKTIDAVISFLSPESKNRILAAFSIKDEKGMYQQFCSAIIYFLKNI